MSNAIQSVRQQTFGDWELVIADNDDGEATRDVVSQFEDPRIRYFRTGNLAMCDNWEFAAQQANGEYITVLEDKQVLKRGALQRVRTELDRAAHAVVTWQHEWFDDTVSPAILHRYEPRNSQAHLYSPEDVLDGVVNGTSRWFRRVMPRGINSAIHKELIGRLRSGPLSRVFAPHAPDYTLGYQVLAVCDCVCHIDEALTVFASKRHSNGHSFMIKGSAAARFRDEAGGDSAFYSHLPLKAVFGKSIVFNDYLRIRELWQGRLEAYPLNERFFLKECFRDILFLKKFGVDMSVEEEMWHAAVNQQPEVTRSQLQQMAKLNRPRSRVRSAIANAAAVLGVRRLLHVFRRHGGPRFGTNAPTWCRYKTALDYVNSCTDEQV